MIFWATVLAFIVGMMYYMMYPRSDTLDTIMKPASDIYINTFVTQHQAARDYSNAILPAISRIAPAPTTTATTDKEKLFILPATMTNFMPPMQVDDSKNSATVGENAGFYTSLIACMNHKDRLKDNGEMDYGTLLNCTDSYALTKYVITYGEVPDIESNLFKNKNTNRLMQWEKAILRRTSGSPDCGYLSKMNGNAIDYYINTSQSLTRKLPRAVTTALQTDFDSASTDLLFCLTPLNNPYVTDGLILHYDAILNGGNTHILQTDTWVNLANNTFNAKIENPSGSVNQWNVADKDNIPLFFNGSRELDTTYDVMQLGNYFTISFVIKYVGINSGENVITFGTGATDTTLLGGLYNGTNIRIGFKNTSYELLAPIPLNKITQITYTVDQTKHVLYVDGVQKAQGDYPPFFTTLSSGNLYIGSDMFGGYNKLKGRMYNFKVYNRPLWQDEISKNLKTDKKRFNF